MWLATTQSGRNGGVVEGGVHIVEEARRQRITIEGLCSCWRG